jgi:hypothetical protein
LPRQQLIRLALAACVGVLAAAGLLGFVSLVNADQGFIGCTATTGLGWLVPLVSGLAVLGLAWALLTPRNDDQELGSGSQRCESCEGDVLDDWRLCPHCGAFIGDRPVAP